MTSVADHYGSGSLEARMLSALRTVGIEPGGAGSVDPEAISPFEEFHSLGRVGTEELAVLARVTAGDCVLDVGSGIGGPARVLARRHGAEVVGIDITPEFVQLALMLSTLVGLDQQVTFETADAVDLPFPDDSFDVVWTQHVAMNIADKPALFRSMHRVCRPGGRLALFDVVGGPGGDLHFPVPWADGPSISFLVPATAVQSALEDAGWEIELWEDVTARATAWVDALPVTPRGPPMGPAVFVDDMPRKMANLARNLHEGRAEVVRAVATKPAPG